MELFNLHIQQASVSRLPCFCLADLSAAARGCRPCVQGRDLCNKLSSVASVIKTPPAQLQSQLAIEVVSPILANSHNPLSVSKEAV